MTANTIKLSALEIEQIRKLRKDQDIKSSDRKEDSARKRLKKLGLITFNRGLWKWRLTEKGWEVVIDETRGEAVINE